MSRTTLVAAGGFAIACLAFLAASSGVGHQQEGLPGARAAIEAVRFSSLQEAIDALPDEGGLVRLPPGRFEIQAPLVINKGDVCLEGAGTATHIVNQNEEGQPALHLVHPEGAQERANNLWRIRLANFRITGNPQSGHGVLAQRINEIFIDGVTVSEHGGDGIRLDQCYEDPRVCDSLITYNKGVGLNLLGCHDIVVSANQFEENQDALHCTDGFNLTMTGNALDDHLGHGVVIENTYGSVVAANMIEECQGTAIILDRDCYGVALSANVIAHNGAGIDLRDAYGCSVSANALTIMKSDALRIGPQSGRIAVTGNSISNSYIGEGKVRRGTGDLAAAGLVLEQTSDVAISGNAFSGVRPKAVLLEGDGPSSRISFDGNVLTDAESDHEQLENSAIGDNVVEK
ncbi:MAG: right-handed parallel beta-helix repeat-containing protein [Planctomycetes bacterium]|nr:right-handed parallel beta-helix repeat-containing protein [Planctomycetota bacterium]